MPFDRILVAITASTRDFRPTLLVLRALGLGDLLTAVPALRGLHRSFRGYRKVLATPRALAPLVRMLGFEHEPVAEQTSLSPQHVDVAVNLHGCGPQSHHRLLVLRPGRFFAYAHPDVAWTEGGPAWDEREHEVNRWCRLTRWYGIDADPRELDLPDVPVRERGDATVIHPGASAPARRWPAARFAAVARAEHETGRRVLITGTGPERPLATRVAGIAGLGPDAVLAGTTDLDGLINAIATAGRVLCGDTGVAHLATALRTPSVVLFGPSSPARWGPPPDRLWHRVLWAGRIGDPHGSRTDEGLLRITVNDVLDALACLHAPRHSSPAR